MYFYDWFIEKYFGRDTMRGDLAEDMKRDKRFPKQGDREKILLHLRSVHACEECIALFKRAYRDFQKATVQNA